MSSQNFSDSEKEFAKFLDRDFTQSFQQMRHYDGQILDICKFAFTGYAAALGAALTIYKYGVDKGIDYRSPAIAILGAGLFLGFCMMAFATRSRAYYVLVARYINEHRAFFLSSKPLGFENRTQMYSNPDQPLFFNWHSAQTLLLVVLSGLNSFLAATLLFLSSIERCWILLTVFIACWLLQLITAIAYLKMQGAQSLA
jgi:hypothetical protein